MITNNDRQNIAIYRYEHKHLIIFVHRLFKVFKSLILGS